MKNQRAISLDCSDSSSKEKAGTVPLGPQNNPFPANKS